MMKRFILCSLIALAVSCSSLPLRPGRTSFSIGPEGAAGKVRQSQNPQQPTTQVYDKTTETPIVPPPVISSVPVEPIIIPATKNTPAYVLVQPPSVVTNPAAPIVVKTTEHMETHIGAAQKDTARTISARLGSLSMLVWVGMAVFLFGAASFVYPPLKVIVGGSMTTSVVITGSGVALMILPNLIVGHEILLIAVAGGAALLYWFAHRHGSLKGTLDTLIAHVVPPKTPPNTPPK